jgi:hypothetical protein
MTVAGPRPRARLLAWRPLRKGSLLGFAKVQFSSGLIIDEITVHAAGTRVWAGPPARPWLRDGAPVLDEKCKPKWQPLVDFSTHGVRSSWTRQVITAVREAQPDVLPEGETP